MNRNDYHRGWRIFQGKAFEPAWMATAKNYDAWTNGEGQWVDNGEKVDAHSREELIAAIDEWISENATFTFCGKQVLRDGQDFAQAKDNDAAREIAAAMNGER